MSRVARRRVEVTRNRAVVVVMPGQAFAFTEQEEADLDRLGALRPAEPEPVSQTEFRYSGEE